MRLNSISKNHKTQILKRVNFVLETEADMERLPDVNTLAPGSSVTIAETGARYILSSDHYWVSDEETYSYVSEIVYDGGELV